MISRRRILSLAIATPALGLPILGLTLRPAQAASHEFYLTDGRAAGGYDPVAYFSEDDAVDGSDDFTLDWRGASWRFASAENMATFESDPSAYAPQYGGYCAYALSQGSLAKAVPEAWTVYEGKLYLNFSKTVRVLWKRDIPGNVAAADGYWPDILQS